MCRWGAGFALVPEPDPGADARMVWERSSPGPSAISPPGSAARRLSTCLVMVVPEQSDDSMRAFEDGASLLLRNTSWERMRDALTTGQPLTLSMSEGTSVSVERVPAVYAVFEPGPAAGVTSPRAPGPSSAKPRRDYCSGGGGGTGGTAATLGIHTHW